MSGCMVGLIWNLLALIVVGIFRVIRVLILLMVTAVSSLFVGVDTAINRISASWIERSTGEGVPIGYNPTAREGVRVAAGLMLVVGWLLCIGTIILIMSIVANT